MKPKSNSQMGSHRKANPLKRVKWLFRPKPTVKTLDGLKPIRLHTPLSPNIRESLNSIELTKALTGEMTDEHHGVVNLSFDIGIRNEIEAIAQTLKDRRGQKIGNPMKMGWGGQLSFSYYLNFFSEYSNFTVKEDRPQASQIPKPYDFLIGTKYEGDSETHFASIEIKTSPYGSRMLNYYKAFNQPYPKYVIVIRCLNEEMTKYELFGWTLGFKVKAHKSIIMYSKKRHSMSLTRTNFDYYSYFHRYVLGLPFKEKFGD